MNGLFTRTDRTIWGRWWWTIDRALLGAISTLIVFGVVLVAAASPPVAVRIGLDQYHFIIRHMIFLIPAIMAMVTVSMMNLKALWRFSTLVLAGGMAMMALVLITGSEIKGAQRWFDIFGFSIQPSEFVKPAFAVVAAWFISKQKDRPDFPGYRITAVIFAVLVALLLMQPDFGMTCVMFSILCAQIFLAGLPLSILSILAIIGAFGAIGAYYTLDHVRSRIDRFFNPESGDMYQINAAMDAFRNGGLFGTGPGQGTVKLGIPDAHSDFIFAVAGEEMGFLFSIVLISILAFIVLRGLNRVMDSDNMFIILATGGLLVMFGIQAFVHMGSNLHMIPTKGMTLPFISYGGSSLVATGIAMGMILSLTRKQPRTSISRSTLSSRPAMIGQF